MDDQSEVGAYTGWLNDADTLHEAGNYRRWWKVAVVECQSQWLTGTRMLSKCKPKTRASCPLCSAAINAEQHLDQQAPLVCRSLYNLEI